MRRVYEIDDMRRLIDDGAQLVEVLPASEFERAHLPGALCIPLREMNADAVKALDPERTVVPYCFDFQCDLSPRAAARLEELGFRDVVDFVPGKAAWLAAGQPSEGRESDADRIGALARHDIPRFGPNDRVDDLPDRFEPWPVGVVLEGDVVVGVVRPEVAALPTGTPLHAALQPGPNTVRPDLTRAEMARRFAKDSLTYVLVTTPGGRFVGALLPGDVLVPA